jgi:hypothetical protein
MAAVDLGKGPKDGSNSADASTDISSADVTRTLGAFNTAGGTGVFGRSARGDGISGMSDGEGMSGVAGVHAGNGNAIYGRAAAPGRAAYFDGTVEVHGEFKHTHGNMRLIDGDIELGRGDIKLMGGDVAEDFQILDAGGVDPGTVMVLDGVDRVRASDSAYDRRVVGIVAGAGDYRPGVVLDHRNIGSGRQPIALVGKTFCKVDASFGAVMMGDLLTTSPTPGHAMKATDAQRAFGAIVGKAMGPLAAGKGLVPLLVMLT